MMCVHAVVALDFVYLQLELSMQACKDHDAFRGLYELMPHFARVSRSSVLCVRYCRER